MKKIQNDRSKILWGAAHLRRLHLTRRSIGLAVTLMMVTIWLGASALHTWAQDSAQDEGTNTASSIYLPMVMGGNDAQVGNGETGNGEGAPTVVEEQHVIAEAITDVNNNAPALEESNVEASTWCSTYIRFANYSNKSVKIYWVNGQNQEVLYATLSGGYYYWQHTYYGHEWVVRDTAGNQIKRFTVNTCYYVYVNIYNSDFPNPTPTPQACTGSIDAINLIDTNTGRAVVNVNPLQDGTTLNLAALPTTITMDAATSGGVSSIKFTVNGDTIVENHLPYNYPATGANWYPSPGTYNLTAKAYSEDGASGQLCDTVTLTLNVINSPIAPNALASCPAGSTPLLVNGSFESPTFSSPLVFKKEWDVPGWKTHASDNLIELWKSYRIEGVPAYDGVQLAEVNATSNAAILQDFATTPGSTILWSFAHRGRDGVDTLRLRIGSTSSLVDQADFSTDNDAWNNYTGTYVVPAGQTTTRIKFEPVSVASGDNSVGNLLDGVLACQLPPASPTPTPPPTNTPTPVPPTATATTAPPPSCPGNLVANGGFEADFANWAIGGYTNADLTISGDANSGAKAALALGQGIFFNQQIAAFAGAMYDLSAFGKVDNGAVFSAVGLNFYDINGTRVERTFAQVTSANYAQTLASIAAPATTAFAEVYVYTDGNINFFVDDICVQRSGGPTPTLTPGPESVKIGDRVWADLNRNGIQDEGGVGIEGLTVDLFEGCTDTVVAATRTTSNSGQYVFTNLAPGDYRIRVTGPAGFVFTQKGAGTPDADSDFNGNGITDCLTLAPGEENFDIDAGLYDPAAPIPTPTPTATPIGGYIGDRVWSDLNRNGAQDTGEPSLEGVTVELLATCAGTSVLETQQTTNSGQYLFRDLQPGQYLVRVTAPSGLVFSPQNNYIDDAGDSDVDSNGITPCISLDPYEEDASVDAGLYDPQGTIPTPTATPTPAGGLIGDRVWNDYDANGTQNAGEPGVAGVTVELLDGCSGTSVLLTDITDSRGEYGFSPLPAGDYRIRVTAPSGFIFSPQDAIGDDFADSDVDASGISSCISLPAFTENTTIDAGIQDPNAPTPTVTNTPVPPTPTNTLVPPTPTFTPTSTATPTNTPAPTNTPVPPTPTPTPGTGKPLVTCPAGSTPLLINGSFEEPVIPSAWQLIDESQVPGWLTNAGDNKIEIWQSTASGIASFDGEQFNELNASSAAALYQDIATTPGSMILWGFAHRGRNGTDTVSLRVGSPTTVAEQAKFNTGNSAWLEFTGTYLVPNGQTTTRIEFQPLSTAGGNNAEGNFVDGIVVCQLNQ